MPVGRDGGSPRTPEDSDHLSLSHSPPPDKVGSPLPEGASYIGIRKGGVSPPVISVKWAIFAGRQGAAPYQGYRLR